METNEVSSVQCDDYSAGFGRQGQDFGIRNGLPRLPRFHRCQYVMAEIAQGADTLQGEVFICVEGCHFQADSFS